MWPITGWSTPTTTAWPAWSRYQLRPIASCLAPCSTRQTSGLYSERIGPLAALARIMRSPRTGVSTSPLASAWRSAWRRMAFFSSSTTWPSGMGSV